MLKPLNRITNCSVVLGAILLTSMGASLAPAQATVLREDGFLKLNAAGSGLFAGFSPPESSTTDPTSGSTSADSTDPPVSAPEPTYAAGVLAFGVLGLGFAWKTLARTR